MGGEDLGKVACLPTTGKNAIYERREFFWVSIHVCSVETEMAS
jgi:hypothetical protein